MKMKNKIQKIAAILFLIVFGANVLYIKGSFIPKSQNISKIGMLLFSSYLIPFELLSIILVASIIGVMFIVRDDEK